MDINKFHTLDIVLLAGVYGSGKTALATKFFKKENRLRVSRSEIRNLLHEMTHFGESLSPESFNEADDALVKHLERKIIEQYLHNKKKTVLINTFMTKKSRKRFIDIAKSSKRTIGIIFLTRPLEQCLERNEQNKISVSEIVIRTMFNKIELPEKDEGFENIAVINYK